MVFAKAPLGGPEGVVRYVGRYTHRVAISNHRILSTDGGKIRFTCRDYRKRDEQGEYEIKEMTLKSSEFIRRFLSHVLPKGFHKIRHFGFLANGRRATLSEVRWNLLLDEEGRVEEPKEDTADSGGGPPCPVCGIGRLLPVFVSHRFGRIVVRNLSYLRLCESLNSS